MIKLLFGLVKNAVSIGRARFKGEEYIQVCPSVRLVHGTLGDNQYETLLSQFLCVIGGPSACDNACVTPSGLFAANQPLGYRALAFTADCLVFMHCIVSLNCCHLRCVGGGKNMEQACHFPRPELHTCQFRGIKRPGVQSREAARATSTRLVQLDGNALPGGWSFESMNGEYTVSRPAY